MEFKKKLESLKPLDLNCNIFSVYDYEGFSVQELLYKFFMKLNEIIDDSTISFMIGGGSSNTTRTNALVVKSGVAMVPGPNNELSRIATMTDLENV